MPAAPLGGAGHRLGTPAPRVRWGRRRRVQVEDGSMRPTLEPGDRLLVDSGAYRDRAPRTGEIVVLVDPDAPERWLVKRVHAVEAETGAVDVRGDASESARDSRRFGPVPVASIVGRAYRLYFPPSRQRDL
jgi:nickel-type superoxide dismutase maturation protease